ncbi:MAG: hypothetical protein ACI9R3_001692 [Verrucomicrobiales bacterium]|jgi:hypothetical protein
MKLPSSRSSASQFHRVPAWCLSVVLCILALQLRAVANPVEWEPLLSQYCFDCHDSDSAKADVDLEAALESPLADKSDLWEQVARQLSMRVMPPIEKDRPSNAEYSTLVSKLESALDAQATLHPNPGRTESLRRLNRTEYQHVIRDLLAVEIDAKKLLPPDQSSHGFDNITVGNLSPALLDRYISAGQMISRLALGISTGSPDGRTVRIRPDVTQEGHVEGLPLGTRGGTLIRHTFPRDGEYDIRIHLMRDRNEQIEGLRGVHELQVLLDGDVATSFKVRPPKNRGDHTKVDAHLSARIQATAGARELGVTFVEQSPDLIEYLRMPYESAFNTHRHPRRSPAVYQVSITGPFDAGDAGQTSSRQRVFGNVTKTDEDGAHQVLQSLLRLAYRGNADDGDLAKAMEFYREGSETGSFETGIESALSAILVSPKFLFRVERDREGATPGGPYALNDLELASRLSFFLWSSIPDEALLDAAIAGDLTKPDGLARQVRRMLADGRSSSLVENFAEQWLYLRNLESVTPDGRLFPDFDDNLRQAMRRETELLFENVLREDRSVVDLISSDFTYLNERLAKHYGIPHVYGDRYRRVTLEPDSGRGGILRHSSILTVTSYATRTSPVLRGHWVLENLLGTPPPPPPADVPALDDNPIDATFPVRQRLAAHRENPACASCHNVMDPIGFAFENFDALGRWRTHEAGVPVDSRGSLPNGTTFDDISGLERGLLEQPKLFVRTLVEKLLTFALGRGVESSDAPAVRRIVRASQEDEFKFSAIILQLVSSDPFTMRMPNPENPQ